MAETQMKVRLIAHTQLTQEFFDEAGDGFHDDDLNQLASDGQAVALTAIRTCYSANKPTEIVAKEGAKYFGSKASDGGAGTDADRLFRHIFASKHTSTLEHISFTFAIEGVSRALLAQLTRHRVGFSFSVQSQRYVRMGSDDKIGGFDYVVPDKVKESEKTTEFYDNGEHEYRFAKASRSRRTCRRCPRRPTERSRNQSRNDCEPDGVVVVLFQT